MRLRTDWLTNTITVPYVPALGPVHPATDPAALFDAALHLRPGEFLPYDKTRHWTDHKDEVVLPAQVRQRPDRIVVATLGRRNGRVSVYHYRPCPPRRSAARDLAQCAAAGRQVRSGRIVWFQPDPPYPHAATGATNPDGRSPDDASPRVVPRAGSGCGPSGRRPVGEYGPAKPTETSPTIGSTPPAS